MNLNRTDRISANRLTADRLVDKSTAKRLTADRMISRQVKLTTDRLSSADRLKTDC